MKLANWSTAKVRNRRHLADRHRNRFLMSTSNTGASFGPRARPIEVRYFSADKRLEIEFDDGVRFSYPAELLRVESPSAEVRGHGTDAKKIVAGRRHVGLIRIEPVGNYAIRPIFDDLHDTGLFSWAYLYELGERQAEIWQDYLDNLAANNLSRDP